MKIPLAKDGFIFILPLLIITVLMFLISFYWATAIFGLGFLFVTWFFRDPERRIPNEPNVIVSPADGKITEIVTENEPINGKLCKRVTIFLSVFNVHVNRVPIGGTIEDIRYNPGKFLAAFNPKASMDNEQNLILINNGRTHIFVKQIAGLIARRIVCWPKKGDYYESGQRYGLIRFGSRVDILLPENTKLSVACGDKVSGGKSIIGYLNSN
ncbi:MAG TPA: phosphatidylserine decarboxylase family protein [Nitrospinaceae bacterium]|jgi:phosphatidylserine decarboxylase|nr:phosphatidylserine decarboxylase family protein [Nitrospinaceae bacterium]HIB43139.1 phosphatidylserine decarboxylase family protein [Nitrospina sp.]HIN87818.1 phosphatidylserine decarboxylase family protein [Nitrospinaceae bacterium]|tara:strand:+ start:756 stop:1391 length:636 start_codon:yes stop_codon:yes gene_type:complete